LLKTHRSTLSNKNMLQSVMQTVNGLNTVYGVEKRTRIVTTTENSSAKISVPTRWVF